MHAFLEEEIDGSSFLLLKETDVVDFRLKTGSMVKLREYLEKLRAVPVSLNDCLTATNSDNIEIDRACANMVTPPPDLNITIVGLNVNIFCDCHHSRPYIFYLKVIWMKDHVSNVINKKKHCGIHGRNLRV